MEVKDYLDMLRYEITELRTLENSPEAIEVAKRVINLESHYDKTFPVAEQPIHWGKHRDNYALHNRKAHTLRQESNNLLADGMFMLIANHLVQFFFEVEWIPSPIITILTIVSACLIIRAFCKLTNSLIKKHQFKRSCNKWLEAHPITEREIWTYADYNQP